MASAYDDEDDALLDIGFLNRQMTTNEVAVVGRIFRVCNMQENTQTGEYAEKEIPAIIKFMAYENFEVNSAGSVQGFAALINRHATVEAGMFGASMCAAHVLYPLREKGAAGRLSDAYFQTDENRNALNVCASETLAEGAKGYDLTMLTPDGELNENSRVPTMGEVDSYIGVVSLATTGVITKQNYFIAVRANQASLSEQGMEFVSLAAKQGLTFDEMLHSETLTMGDGTPGNPVVSSASFFKNCRRIALLGTYALAARAARALRVNIDSNSGSIEGDAKGCAHTFLNYFADTPDKNTLIYRSEVANTADSDATGVVLFRNFATFGIYAVCGPENVHTQYRSVSRFDRALWNSTESLNSMPTSLGQRFALKDASRDAFKLSNMSADMQEASKFMFTFNTDDTGNDPHESMNHALCTDLYKDPSEDLATFRNNVEKSFMAFKNPGINLKGVALKPVITKLSCTPMQDLPYVPVDAGFDV